MRLNLTRQYNHPSLSPHLFTIIGRWRGNHWTLRGMTSQSHDNKNYLLLRVYLVPIWINHFLNIRFDIRYIHCLALVIYCSSFTQFKNLKNMFWTNFDTYNTQGIPWAFFLGNILCVVCRLWKTYKNKKTYTKIIKQYLSMLFSCLNEFLQIWVKNSHFGKRSSIFGKRDKIFSGF